MKYREHGRSPITHTFVYDISLKHTFIFPFSMTNKSHHQCCIGKYTLFSFKEKVNNVYDIGYADYRHD